MRRRRAPGTIDQRRRRTRAALLRAFAELLQTQRYEDIRVPDIARRAQVGRSTFYDNFRGKDAILASSIAAPFGVLASCIQPQTPGSELVALFEHFWANRRLARGLLVGPVRQKATAVLIRQIEQLLKLEACVLQLPPRLVAVQLAEVLFAPIIAWLLGEVRCTPELLARALPRAAQALLSQARAAC